MTEFEEYYRDHPPFDIIYTPGILTHAQSEFLIGLYPSGGMAIMQKVLDAVSDGLNAAGSREKWGFGTWPHSAALFNGYKKYTVQAVLLDGSDREISRADVDLYTQLALVKESICYDSSQNMPVFFDGMKKETITGNMRIRIISMGNMNVAAAKQTPPVINPTIPENLRSLPQIQDSAARKKAGKTPKETAPASPMDTRFGIIAGGLLSPMASVETASAMASLEWGMKHFTLEAMALLVPQKLQSVAGPDDLVFGIGGGVGTAFVTDHLLATFSGGVSAANLRDWGMVLIPYGHLRIDFLPWGRGLGLRLGFMAEAGAPGWGEAYRKYFDEEWTFGADWLRINPRIMLGLGLWL
ncbi:hypothetical protein FACS1894147_11760 [Spirochaetia bacterium]|nr:hypothetical protein FACS1894147_11760 [Spirochaetia bacterium]